MRFPEARDRRKLPGLISGMSAGRPHDGPDRSRHELHPKVRIAGAKRVHLWSSNGRDRSAELGEHHRGCLDQHFSRIVLDGARDVGRRGWRGDVPLRLPTSAVRSLVSKRATNRTSAATRESERTAGVPQRLFQVVRGLLRPWLLPRPPLSVVARGHVWSGLRTGRSCRTAWR